MSTSGHHSETKDGADRDVRSRRANERDSGIEAPGKPEILVGPKNRARGAEPVPNAPFEGSSCRYRTGR